MRFSSHINGVAKKMFNQKVAIASCLIYTFSSFIINAERIQWPVNFIAPDYL